jgi:hypothetical protein
LPYLRCLDSSPTSRGYDLPTDHALAQSVQAGPFEPLGRQLESWLRTALVAPQAQTRDNPRVTGGRSRKVEEEEVCTWETSESDTLTVLCAFNQAGHVGNKRHRGQAEAGAWP